MGESHERNLTEKATILALAFRAGLFNSQNGASFLIEPATKDFDMFGKFDVIVYKNKAKLRVDVTSSYRFKKFKIDRAIRRARQGRRWPFILKVDWRQAAFLTLDECFDKAWDQIKDGVPIALEKACPIHGNTCPFAAKLLKYSEEVNFLLVNEKTQARYFSMPIKNPPF